MRGWRESGLFRSSARSGAARWPPISPSHPVRFQELPRAQDGNAPKGFELTKVFIPRDHNLSFRCDGPFENAVIRFVLSDELDRFLRVDEPSKLLDGGEG